MEEEIAFGIILLFVLGFHYGFFYGYIIEDLFFNLSIENDPLISAINVNFSLSVLIISSLIFLLSMSP